VKSWAGLCCQDADADGCFVGAPVDAQALVGVAGQGRLTARGLTRRRRAGMGWFRTARPMAPARSYHRISDDQGTRLPGAATMARMSLKSSRHGRCAALRGALTALREAAGGKLPRPRTQARLFAIRHRGPARPVLLRTIPAVLPDEQHRSGNRAAEPALRGNSRRAGTSLRARRYSTWPVTTAAGRSRRSRPEHGR
jgi:hypothetical protein